MLNFSGFNEQDAAASTSGDLVPSSLDRLNWPVQTHRQHKRPGHLLVRAEAKLTDSTREGEEAKEKPG